LFLTVLTLQHPDAKAMAIRPRALTFILEACDRETAARRSTSWGTSWGTEAVACHQTFYNGHQHDRNPPAGPGRCELLPPQSLVTVHASAPATDPRVATASRRKVVGVDCV